MQEDKKIKNWGKVDYIDLTEPVDKDEKCLLAEAAKKEMNKPAHLRQFAFHISCRCKRCRVLMY